MTEEQSISVSQERLVLARDSLLTQAAALEKIAQRLDQPFDQAIEMILACQGRVVLCGMGKSGIIAQKIAATFASTGTTSFFMHPAEAFHGDLGMLTHEDLLILISYSGETEEVIKLIPSLQQGKNKIIAIVGERHSTLAKHADVVLNIQVDREVCPNNLAPTTSTLATMAIGDALAVVLIKERNFQPADFARFHPGGSLGKLLLTQVRDVMHTGDLPLVFTNTSLRDAIYVMTQGRLGLVVIVDTKRKILGLITDGDLRRALNQYEDIRDLNVEDVMTTSPHTIAATTKLADAEQIMLDHKIKALLVADEQQRLIGIIDIFDNS